MHSNAKLADNTTLAQPPMAAHRFNAISQGKQRWADTEQPPDIKFPVSDDKIKTVKRFISEDVAQLLEQAQEGTQVTCDGNVLEPKDYPRFKVNIKKYIGLESLKRLTFTQGQSVVQYFKRANVGGKTRWYKIADKMQEICIVQDIESNEQKLFLQALLIQMDNKLHRSNWHPEKYLDQACRSPKHIASFTFLNTEPHS